jgi:hypothetical protein
MKFWRVKEIEPKLPDVCRDMGEGLAEPVFLSPFGWQYFLRHFS